MTAWPTVELGELVEKSRGISYGVVQPGRPTSDGVPIVRVSDVRNGRINTEAPLRVSPTIEASYSRTRLRGGELLITVVGTIGETAIVPSELIGWNVARAIAVLPVEKDVGAYWIKLALCASAPKQMIQSRLNTTVQPTLNLGVVEKLPIVLPPTGVRERIVSVLGAYDDLIEINRRRIVTLEEMARRVFDEWFVHFRFPGFEKLAHQPKSSDHMPLGWEVRRVEELVKRIPVGKKYDQKTVCATGSIPVLDQGRSGIIGYHDEQPGVVASEDSPVIAFANHTCYKRIIHFPFSAIQNVLPFVSHPSLPRNIYWLHWATNGLVTLNDYKGHWPEFISKNVMVPTIDLAERFGRLVGPTARFVLKLERANEVLSRTRDLLLPRLISGELSIAAAEHELEAVA